jgi:hypothetical protein
MKDTLEMHIDTPVIIYGERPRESWATAFVLAAENVAEFAIKVSASTLTAGTMIALMPFTFEGDNDPEVIKNKGKEVTDTKNEEGKGEKQKLSDGEIKKLKDNGVDVHKIKKGKGEGKADLYKDRKVNIYTKIKNSSGNNGYEPTGYNINDYKWK